eukprot:g3339.t1
MPKLKHLLPEPKTVLIDQGRGTEPIKRNSVLSGSSAAASSILAGRNTESTRDASRQPSSQTNHHHNWGNNNDKSLLTRAKGGAGAIPQSSALVKVSIDSTTGEKDHTAILRQGSHKKTHFGSRFNDLVEKKFSDTDLQRPSALQEEETRRRTAARMQSLISGKVAASRPVKVPERQKIGGNASYIHYKPSSNSNALRTGSNTQSRVIRMSEAPKDPLEPPKHKHVKVPPGPPEDQVPIMHAPAKKLTAQDHLDWKIPPCVSNWKNSRGYIIPLDKRMAADGRGLQENTINDNFAKFAEALYVAENKAREEIRDRNIVQQRLLEQQKDAEEKRLQEIAKQSSIGLDPTTRNDTTTGQPNRVSTTSNSNSGGRLVANGLANAYGSDSDDDSSDNEGDNQTAKSKQSIVANATTKEERNGQTDTSADDDDKAALEEYERKRKERDELRRQRKREIERDFRLERAGKKKKIDN